MFATNTIDTIANDNGEKCSTILYQGLFSSQTLALKYVGGQKIKASTGQMMWCTGRNNLPPLKVVYQLHIGNEIADVNLQPFNTYSDYFNPVKLANSFLTYQSNRWNGFQFEPATVATPQSVVFHTTNFNEFSMGQTSDILSHYQKYQSWLNSENRTKSLILYGVSRGTAATFCAFAKYKYPEVKLVILEGAVDSISNIIPYRVLNVFKSEVAAKTLTPFVNKAFSFFKSKGYIKYDVDGPSPLSCIDEFPEGVPVVFITSKIDSSVPPSNTENIAKALANKGKNDVYLLKLERSSHSNYMFDDVVDRDNYESFIHAIYKKYHLQHDPVLAEKGKHLLEIALLKKEDALLTHARTGCKR